MDELASRSHPIQEDMRFQQKTWRSERIAWVIIAVLLAAGLGGLFFHGPLSYRVATSDNSAVSVEYERFTHKTVATHFVIRLAPSAKEGFSLLFDPQFTQTYDIDSIEPRPARSSGGSRGLELHFAASQNGDLTLHIAARPKRFGLLDLAVTSGEQGSVRFFQLIYP